MRHASDDTVEEDIVMGYLAKERDSKSKKNDFISEKEVLKKLGINGKML